MELAFVMAWCLCTGLPVSGSGSMLRTGWKFVFPFFLPLLVSTEIIHLYPSLSFSSNTMHGPQLLNMQPLPELTARTVQLMIDGVQYRSILTMVRCQDTSCLSAYHTASPLPPGLPNSTRTFTQGNCNMIQA